MIKKDKSKQPSEYRCETCDYEPKTKDWHDPKYLLWKKCPYKDEENYHDLKEEIRIPEGVFLFTRMCGCTSHSDFNSTLREYVNRDLIEHLEDMISEANLIGDLQQAHQHRVSIGLLKNEVEKWKKIQLL